MSLLAADEWRVGENNIDAFRVYEVVRKSILTLSQRQGFYNGSVACSSEVACVMTRPTLGILIKPSYAMRSR